MPISSFSDMMPEQFWELFKVLLYAAPDPESGTLSHTAINLQAFAEIFPDKELKPNSKASTVAGVFPVLVELGLATFESNEKKIRLSEEALRWRDSVDSDPIEARQVFLASLFPDADLDSEPSEADVEGEASVDSHPDTEVGDMLEPGPIYTPPGVPSIEVVTQALSDSDEVITPDSSYEDVMASSSFPQPELDTVSEFEREFPDPVNEPSTSDATATIPTPRGKFGKGRGDSETSFANRSDPFANFRIGARSPRQTPPESAAMDNNLSHDMSSTDISKTSETAKPSQPTTPSRPSGLLGRPRANQVEPTTQQPSARSPSAFGQSSVPVTPKDSVGPRAGRTRRPADAAPTAGVPDQPEATDFRSLSRRQRRTAPPEPGKDSTTDVSMVDPFARVRRSPDSAASTNATTSGGRSPRNLAPTGPRAVRKPTSDSASGGSGDIVEHDSYVLIPLDADQYIRLPKDTFQIEVENQGGSVARAIEVIIASVRDSLNRDSE